MDDIQLLEAIEKYLAGEMSPAEAAQFESIRKNTPEIDQMVVEHSMFLHEMDNFAKRKNFTRTTEITFNTLFEAGEWTPVDETTTKYKVVQLWHRYKKVTAIVTRDAKGFRRSNIPALNYREALAMVQANSNHR
mgnify:CR=1 FL=1